MVKRIHVTYKLAGVAEDEKETVARVHDFHADKCPVARSISPQIGVTTSIEYV